MNTKLVMTASAVTLGLAGILLTFMPLEVVSHLDLGVTKSVGLLLQILGALYFSFAMLNWMSRKSVIGGIYNRPMVVANVAHFTIAGLGLIRGVFSDPGLPDVIRVAAGIYSIYAILFGVMLFRHPSDGTKPG